MALAIAPFLTAGAGSISGFVSEEEKRKSAVHLGPGRCGLTDRDIGVYSWVWILFAGATAATDFGISSLAMTTVYKKASAQARRHSDDARESSDRHGRELAEIRGFAADAAENLEVTKSKRKRRKPKN